MKYNALLTGSLNSAIDDFFAHMGSVFNCVTTSLRYDDITRHIRFFEPHIFIICLSNENSSFYSCIPKLKAECAKNDVTIAIMGDRADCDEFCKLTGFEPELVFIKPITIPSIINQIKDLLEYKELERQRAIEAEKAAEKAAAEREAAEAAANEKKHILIIDDDANMLKAIKAQLDDKYSVGTAINGNIAIRFLQRKTTDLILLDYEMPGENGADVLKRLRADSATKDIPVIFLTGVSDVERIKKVLSMKPQGYLLKPVDKDKLMDIIDKTLNK